MTLVSVKYLKNENQNPQVRTLFQEVSAVTLVFVQSKATIQPHNIENPFQSEPNHR